MFVGEYSNPKLVTMELTSEKDLFLCYRFRCKDGDTRSDPEYEYFEKIKRDQDLMIGYEKLPSLLKDLLSQVGNKDKVGRVNAIFDMAGGECGAATLKFEHDSDFISVPLLLIEFQYIEEENLKNNVAFRINSKKQKTRTTLRENEDPKVWNNQMQKIVEEESEKENKSNVSLF